MEDEIDIYADLPAFDSKQESDNKNDQSCNCAEIKKNFDLLMNKLEKIQKSKEILELNLSSLLKTAKLEIARKDKMIENLRKRLDDVTFKRNTKNESLAQRLSYQQQNYENVTLTYSNEIEPQQTESYRDRYEGRKQNDDHSDQKLTLFGERLHKRIMESEKEEKKQLASSKCSIEPSAIDISEENIMESDKENGSQSGINNKSNDFTIAAQNSNSEVSRKKNSEKRRNSDDSMHETKRFKLDSDKEKTLSSETDNCITRYDLKDNLTEYERESNVDFDDRPDIGHSVRTKRAPYSSTRRRATSEHEDVKEDRDIVNYSQKKKEEGNLVRDYNGKRFTENSKSFRTTSTSNHASERSNSSYKKNGYRYNSLRRSHSRSKSDHETSSSHRFQERSKKYRDSKYDDYRDSKHDDYKNRKYNDYRDSKYDDYRDNKYDDARYKSDRFKRISDIKESRSDKRCSSGERDLRSKLKTSTSDVEDRGNSSSYRDKHESRRIRSTKVAEVNTSDNKRLDKNSEAAAKIDTRTSPSRTVGAKNESDTEATTSIENTITNIAEKSLNLEEGEILDSPEKNNSNNNSANQTSKNITANKNREREDCVRVVSIEDKAEDIPVNASVHETAISLENNAVDTKQEKVADIKQNEAASPLSFPNSKEDRAETTRSSSPPEGESNEVFLQTRIRENDDDACKSHFDKDLNSDSTAHHVEVVASEQVCDRNTDDDTGKTCTDEKSQSSVVTKLADESKTETDDSNTESATETEETNDSVLKNLDKKEKTNNFDNEGDDNHIHKTSDKETTSCTSEIATTFRVAFDCDNKNKDRNQVSVESDVCHETRKDKSNAAEMSRLCLRDHNYVQNSVTFDHDASVRQTSVSSECVEATPEAVAEETKAAETVNAQSNGAKKTSLAATKSKKDQQSKGVIILRRRRAVTLSDNNASMTVLRNTKVEETVTVASSDSVLKPRACKALRAHLK